MQNGHPVAFYSRKLTPCQQILTTIKKELLLIVKTIWEFCTILFGCRELRIHTDHKNLTYANFTSQHVLRWRLFLEEYNPIFHYIKGSDNTIADAFSWLPCLEGQSPAVKQAFSPKESELAPGHFDDHNSHAFSIMVDDDDMLECFLNFPEVDFQHPFALDYQGIANA